MNSGLSHDFKNWIKNNVWIIFFGSMFAVGSTSVSLTYAVTSYFHQQEINRINQNNVAEKTAYTAQADLRHQSDVTKIGQYENQLASINRNLAGGDYFNVANLLILRSDKSKVPPNSKFYEDEMFYAPTSEGWNYRRTSDVDFFNSIYGQPGKTPADDITKLAPVNIWQRGDYLEVDGHSLIKNVAPIIYLQKFSTKDLADSIGLDNPIDPIMRLELQTSFSNKEFLKAHLHAIFQGDIVGALLARSLSETFLKLRFIDKTDVQLVSINKVQNVLYTQSLITLQDVKVNNKSYNRYYINMENIVVSTSSNVYAIILFSPSDEPLPRGVVAAEITTWLNEFRILAD